MGKKSRTPKKVVSVFLDAGDAFTSSQLFYCFRCRNPLIAYHGDVITIVPGSHPYEPKTTLQCKGDLKNEDGQWEFCNTHYQFMMTVRSERTVF